MDYTAGSTHHMSNTIPISHTSVIYHDAIVSRRTRGTLNANGFSSAQNLGNGDAPTVAGILVSIGQWNQQSQQLNVAECTLVPNWSAVMLRAIHASTRYENTPWSWTSGQEGRPLAV